jgi:hypothetical protein
MALTQTPVSSQAALSGPPVTVIALPGKQSRGG